MKKSIIISVVVGVVALGIIGAWWLLSFSKASEGEATTNAPANPGSIIRFSGEVKAKQYAELGFETNGIAKLVEIKVGNKVEENQQLIVLDRQLQEVAVAGAFANKISAQDNTLISWEATKSALAKTKAKNKQTVVKARQKVIDSKAELDQSREVLNRTTNEDGNDAANTASKELAFKTIQKVYNNAQEELTEMRKTADKENEAAINVAEQAEAAYAATTQASLNSTGASSLLALETSARVQLARKILTAPFAGIVTKLEIKPNELVLGGQPVITIQTIDDLEIEAQVSETDITKVSVGQKATVTFDAFGAEPELFATVSRVYPAGEKIDGITRYTVYLDIHNSKQRLRPGFTANIIINE